MSFKRVADDFDDFKLQKKRRVNDLLLDAIPTDEVALIKNGKLACLVCSHKPVFDTTAMLSIHRKGKKHIANSLVKLERAKEDAEIRQKREHESYIIMKQNGSENPLLELTRLKKEQAINYRCVSQSQSSNEYNSELDGNSTNQGTNKSFFCKKTSSSFEGSSSNSTTSSLSKNYSSLRDKTLKLSEKNNPKRERFLSVNPLTKQKSNFYATQSMGDVELNQTNSTTCSTRKQTESTILQQSNSSSTFYSHDQHSSLNSLDSKSKALYLSKLRQIGWILGTDGKWEKDKDAEFESDEDEPPSPKTVLSE